MVFGQKMLYFYSCEPYSTSYKTEYSTSYDYLSQFAIPNWGRGLRFNLLDGRVGDDRRGFPSYPYNAGSAGLVDGAATPLL
jgi:hypothetical protein